MTSFAPLPSDAFIDELLADMERLGKRPYAEIGVPMFLVAEDLTAEAGDRAAVNATDGAQLAALFAQAADALKTRRPELSASDIARLVEVIADRHFLGFAGRPFSQIGELHPQVD
jgi:hypothetical protein